MDIDIRTLAAAGLIAGVIGFGGTAIAGAQEAPEERTTTSEAPAEGAAPDAGRDREGCDKDGAASDESETEGTTEGTSL